jgi:hypothetical protein
MVLMDRQFLRIDDKWALAYDERQWILQRFRGIRSSGYGVGLEKWEGVSFVTSTRDVLARCMREKGVPADAALVALAGLPETFSEFRAWMGRQIDLEAGRSASELPADAG